MPHQASSRVFALMRWLCVVVGCFLPALVFAKPDAPNAHLLPATQVSAGQGYIEKTQLSDGVLTLKGWAAPHNPSVFVTMVTVWLGEHEIYRGRLGFLTSRPDVVQATNQPLWLTSGFDLPVRVPASVEPGAYALRVRITNGDGGTFELQQSGPEAQAQIVIEQGARQPSLRAQGMLWLALLLPVAALLWGYARNISTPNGARIFCASVLASFALLVAGGWTGSSMPLLLDRSHVLAHDAAAFIGKAQEVRRDEWGIVTPLAISQTRQAERFASVNTLHGVYGQNMNVVGMTGAPTATLAELAKPVSWGFLAFDLKRALAWYWWLPFFACYLALWALLRSWFAMDWRHAALLALLGPASAYSVGWSGWPAYVSFFPLLASLAFANVFKTERAGAALLHGLILGWAAAGFVLVLYPGWQVPLGYLMGIVTLTHLWQVRSRLSWRFAQWLGVICAGVIAALLIGAWWQDAKDAIVALGQTVYPGQRSLELGGYVEPWHLSKGLINLVTLYESSQWSIPSDAAGHIYLFVPMLVASALLAVVHRSAINGMVIGLWLLVAFMLVSLFVGIPAWLARFSFWGMVPAFRLDVALGLAQVFLLAWLLQNRQSSALMPSTGNRSFARNVLALMTGIGFAAFNWHLLRIMPVPMQNWLTPAVLALVLTGAGVLAFLIVRGQMLAAIVITVAWTLTTSLPFNPVWQAPQNLRLVPELESVLQADKQQPQPIVAVINEDLWVSALPAAGVHVVNSFFYDPPLRFWRDLDPSGAQRPIYNRYQFLQIKLQPELADNQDFQISSPRMDAVFLNVKPTRFDFSKLHANYVLANQQDAELLKANLRLELVKTDNAHWTLFKVVGQ